jgi:hypothetical protein
VLAAVKRGSNVKYPKINSLWKRQNWCFDREKIKAMVPKKVYLTGEKYNE